MTLTDADLLHLRRCVELAREALEAGDQPFGSLLVDGSGVVRREDRNRAGAGDETQHPELALAQWSASLTPEERASATVYTSGEHCPMCAAAHAWMGLGRLVYAVSAAELATWRADWGLPDAGVGLLAVGDLAPDVVVDGPAPELEEELRQLHERAARSTSRRSDGVPPTARRLGLERHPEGGWFRETWRSATELTLPDGRRRPTATLIWFLLPAGESSAWHRVASEEVWLAHEGSVSLQLGGDADAPTEGEVHLVGMGVGQAPEVVVPAGHWQQTLPSQRDALVRCLVSPGFDFEDFELAATPAAGSTASRD
jgi:predicted cupin superfamily sugar epimerase/tRNA(Arg) A34 adenosine deaminase TadA